MHIMGMINGGSLSIDSKIRTLIEEALNRTGKNDNDLIVRIKRTQNGDIEVRIDKGANGNFISRTINKAKLQFKSDHNQTVAMLWLQQFSQKGTNDAKISQENINTALKDRKVVTVGEARRLLAKGDSIDHLRNTPRNSLEQIANNKEHYVKSGDTGVQMLQSHLHELNVVNSQDPGTLRQLSKMLSFPELNAPGAVKLRNVVAQTWQEAGQHLTRNGNKAKLNKLLASADNLDDVQALKNSMRSLAKGGNPKITACYNRIQNRAAELTGIREAKDVINQGKYFQRGQQALENSLNKIEFSSRPDHNKTLQQTALESAVEYLKSHQPAMPDTTALANFFAMELPVGDKAKFHQQFANGLKTMVEEGKLPIDDLQQIQANLNIYGAPRSKPHEQSLKELAISLTLPAKVASAKVPPVKTVLRKAAPPEAPSKTDEELRSEIVQTNLEHFNNLKSRTKKLLSKTEYVQLEPHQRRFKDIKSPVPSNVPVAPSGTPSSAPKKGMIHANFMPLPEKESAIATQYPTPQSMAMFWRMTLQHHTQMVVDLTQDKEKLIHYYPDKPNMPINYDGMQVTLVKSNNNIKTYKVVDTQTNETHTVQRYHYKKWMDFGGASDKDLKQLVTMLNNPELKNVTVHCRAGVGRTATMFAAAVLQNKISAGELTVANKDEVIDEVILEMRAARGSKAVQTEEQRLLLSDLVDQMLN